MKDLRFRALPRALGGPVIVAGLAMALLAGCGGAPRSATPANQTPTQQPSSTTPTAPSSSSTSPSTSSPSSPSSPSSSPESASPPPPSTSTPPSVAVAVETNATVTKITDGDTIHVNRNGKDQTIRLIGMDTPETKKPNTAVECFGTEASAHMRELLPLGTKVRLERDVEERDRYDRILAYVFRDDGLFVNLAMVEDGFAGQLTIPPNVAHVDEFGAAARTAREQGKGLWSACGGNHVAGGK